MKPQTAFTARPYSGDADLQAMCDLINLCNRVDKLDDEPYASIAGTRSWLESSVVADKARDRRLWWGSQERLVGLGVLRTAADPDEGKVDTSLYFRVHPDARNSGVDSEIIEWGSDIARQVGRERRMPAFVRCGLHLTTPEYVAYRQELLESHDFRPVRYGYKMARPLSEPIPEPRLPEGFTLRPAQGEPDVEPWVEMFNQSFIDHWNFHPMTIGDRKHHLTNPDYDPNLDLIAIAPDGTFAAFAFCTIDPEGNAAGNISEGTVDILGTRRGFRRIGLGRAVLQAGMRVLKAAGMETAVLGVDAENPTGALKLYESEGFYVANTTVNYQKDLDLVPSKEV
jgi:mycothiol synthase